MLFITSYNIKEDKDWSPSQNKKTRKISLNSDNPEPGRSIYFCQRQGANKYVMNGNKAFFGKMKGSPGVVFKHIFETTVTGRVPADQATRRAVLKG